MNTARTPRVPRGQRIDHPPLSVRAGPRASPLVALHQATSSTAAPSAAAVVAPRCFGQLKRSTATVVSTVRRPPSPDVIPVPETILRAIAGAHQSSPSLDDTSGEGEHNAARADLLHSKQQRPDPAQEAKARRDLERAVAAHLKLNAILLREHSSATVQQPSYGNEVHRHARDVTAGNQVSDNPGGVAQVGGAPQCTRIPGVNATFMETVFARDMWHHVDYSGLRVAYCRCGGSTANPTFTRIRHQPQFLSTLPGDDEQEDRVEATLLHKGSGGGPRLGPGPTRHGASQGTSGAKQDRETLLFRLTQDSGGTRRDPPPPTPSPLNLPNGDSRRHRQDTCPVPLVAHVSLLEVRGDGVSAAQSSNATRLSPEQSLVAKAIGAPNAEFRRMVAYRRQNVHERRERASGRLADQLHSLGHDDGVDQHARFQQDMQEDSKALYLDDANEVERWTADRDRMFLTKYRTMDISGSYAQSTWQTALSRLRSKVASTLEAEFAQERFRLQREFFVLFEREIRRLFPQLSVEATRLLEHIEAALSRGEPFGAANVSMLVKSATIDNFFLDDFISILYSLAVSLDVPNQHWRDIIRAQTHFLSHRKELVEPDDDPQSARWVLRIRPAEIGPILFLLATCYPACRSLSSEELRSLIRHYPTRRLVDALLRMQPKHAPSEELKGAVADLIAKHLIRSSAETPPSLPPVKSSNAQSAVVVLCPNDFERVRSIAATVGSPALSVPAA